MIDTAKCETCPATFTYDRVSSHRRFCDDCIRQRRMKWSKWSTKRDSEPQRPKRRLIPYAGFEHPKRHDF